MHAKPTVRRPKRRLLALAIGILMVLLLPAVPARALIGVTGIDGVDSNAGNHPNVGAIWWLLDDCGGKTLLDGETNPCVIPEETSASGVLIAPNVVLTVANNGIRNGRRVAVSFDAQIRDRFPGTSTDTIYRGFVLRNPQYCQKGSGSGCSSQENNFDMAVVILDKPVVGITPATLAGLGALDALKGTKQSLTAVGYGAVTGFPKNWVWDWSRRSTTWTISGLKKSVVQTTAPGQHSPCDGDEGGPILAGKQNDANAPVAAIISRWNGFCGGTGIGTGYRMDTTDAYQFLCNVGTDGWASSLHIPNLNAPVIPGEFVDYPSIKRSAPTLAQYCNPGGAGVQTAAARDAGGPQHADHGQQQADNQHQSKHKKASSHQHKQRGGQ